jgi:hypothetical protein
LKDIEDYTSTPPDAHGDLVSEKDDQGNKQIIRIRRRQCTPSSTMLDLLETMSFSSAA